jgi:hypothetical protein
LHFRVIVKFYHVIFLTVYCRKLWWVLLGLLERLRLVRLRRPGYGASGSGGLGSGGSGFGATRSGVSSYEEPAPASRFRWPGSGVPVQVARLRRTGFGGLGSDDSDSDGSSSGSCGFGSDGSNSDISNSGDSESDGSGSDSSDGFCSVGSGYNR